MMDGRLAGLFAPLLATVVLLSACGDGSGPAAETTAPPSAASKPAGSPSARQADQPIGAPAERAKIEKPDRANPDPVEDSDRAPRAIEGGALPAAKNPTPTRDPNGPCAENPGSRECEESRDPNPSAPASGSKRQLHGDEPASEPPACPAGGCTDSDTHP